MAWVLKTPFADWKRTAEAMIGDYMIWEGTFSRSLLENTIVRYAGVKYWGRG